MHSQNKWHISCQNSLLPLFTNPTHVITVSDMTAANIHSS